MLTSMTKQQLLDIYQKFAGRILCINSTHKTNSYLYKLITLMVAEECRKGYVFF